MGAGRGRRTGIIIIVLILVVVLIAVAGIFLLQGGLPGSETADGGGGAEEATPVPTATPPPTLNVIVAARDIRRGTRLTAEDVTTLAWPLLQEAPPPVAVLVAGDGEDAAGLEQVEGRIARTDILNGQPILEFMITPGEEPVGVSDSGSDAALAIPSGMVAIAVPINRLTSVAYALREGDHVDIFMSYNFVDVDQDFQTILPNDTIYLTDNPELVSAGFQQLQIPAGREERGLFGTTLLVVPAIDQEQIPRRTTQLVIDNVIVMKLGDWSLDDVDQPLVVTPIPTATPAPETEGEAEGEGQAEQAPPTPTPGPPTPDVVTLAMPRQDVAVLMHSLLEGAEINIALRSALDDDIADIVTDPVTLDYIINFYNVTPPERLPVALDPRDDLLNLFQQELGSEGAGEDGSSEGGGG